MSLWLDIKVDDLSGFVSTVTSWLWSVSSYYKYRVLRSIPMFLYMYLNTENTFGCSKIGQIGLKVHTFSYVAAAMC